VNWASTQSGAVPAATVRRLHASFSESMGDTVDEFIKVVSDDLESVEAAEKKLKLLRAILIREGKDEIFELKIQPNDFKRGKHLIALYKR